MTNKYDAFTGLMNAALHAADFLDLTAIRSKNNELSEREYQNRLTDSATLLRDRAKVANEIYFLPDPK